MGPKVSIQSRVFEYYDEHPEELYVPDNSSMYEALGITDYHDKMAARQAKCQYKKTPLEAHIARITKRLKAPPGSNVPKDAEGNVDFDRIDKSTWQPFKEFVGYVDENGEIHRGEAIPEPIDQDTDEYKGILWYQLEGFKILEENDNVLILWPRGHGKTWLLAWYIEWHMKHMPFKCMYLSMTDVINDVADWIFTWAWENNLLAEGENVEKAIRKNTPRTFNLVNGSKFKIFSIMDKAVRGKHDYFIFMDDIIEEGSETHPFKQRELERRWNSTISKMRRRKLVIVNTRVYEGDFIEYLINQFERKYEIMKLKRPELAHKWKLHIDLRTPYLDEEQTQLLAPELYTHEYFEAMKAENIRSFYAEMMQDPRPRIGGMWQEEDIHYVSTWGDFWDYERAAIGVDFAWTEKEASDYTAIVVVLKRRKEFRFLVVRAVIRKMPVRTTKDHNTGKVRQGILETIQEVYEWTRMYFPPDYTSIIIPVEMNSGGSIIVDQARRESEKFTFAQYIKEINHRKDKIKRIEAELEQPIKNGTIEFLSDLKESMLIDQILVFPKGKHDDGVDALGMAKNELTNLTPSAEKYEEHKRLLERKRRAKDEVTRNENVMNLSQLVEKKYGRRRRAIF